MSKDKTVSPMLFAAITGQVIDTSSNPWGFCTLQFFLQVPSGQRPIDLTTGQAIPTPAPIVADVNGNFTASLQTNATIVPQSQWMVTIFPFNNQRNGQTLLPFNVAGAMNLSAAISSQLHPAVDTPLILPMSNSGPTGQSPLNGSIYFDIEANDLFVKSPSGAGYIPIGGGPANEPTLNQLLPATAAVVWDTEFNTFIMQGTPPPAGSATGAGGQFMVITANTGQGTTGTTGQVGGVGGDLSIGGGNGGNAPAGGTNGAGGNVFINGGRAGNGPGAAGTHGPVVISQSGDTYIGGTVASGTNVHISLGGALFAAGTITSGASKAFRIKHPLDDKKDLLHACIEGPEVGVYYRGEAETDEGRAEITLPDYFEALTRPEGRSVLLTQLYQEEDDALALLAATSVIGGKFRVRSSNPTQKFYWEVKAIRGDVEPLQVEQTHQAPAT